MKKYNRNNKNHKGKGDKHAQRQRRRKNNQGGQRQEDEYQMIDGNYTHYPVAYCTRYDGYMTQNMMMRHNCQGRNCFRLRMFQEMHPELEVAITEETNSNT